MLLIGAVPGPITSTPRVLLVYFALILMLAAALASVLLPNLLHAILAFALAMASLAFLYLLIQPVSSAGPFLFAVQLVVASVVPGLLMLGLLRRTSALERPVSNPHGREFAAGLVVAGALVALMAIVLGAAAWPVKIAPDLFVDLGRTITESYPVALAVSVVLVGSSALGAWFLVNQRGAAHRPASVEVPGRRGRRRPVDRLDA